MVNYREILRLTSLGYSQWQIDESVHSSGSTIREVQALARKVGLTLPLDDSIQMKCCRRHSIRNI